MFVQEFPRLEIREYMVCGTLARSEIQLALLHPSISCDQSFQEVLEKSLSSKKKKKKKNHSTSLSASDFNGF